MGNQQEGCSASEVRGCPDCGLLSVAPEAACGMAVICPRCYRVLRRWRSHSLDYILACYAAGLIFCAVLLAAPFIHIMLYGRFQDTTLWTGAEVLDQQQLLPLAWVVLATTLIMPLIRLVLMNMVLVGIRLETCPVYLVRLFRLLRHIAPWAMLEVYLLGVLVAYTRLHAMAFVQVDIAVYALCGAIILTSAADVSLDHEEIWQKLKRGGQATTDMLNNALRPLLGCHECFYASNIAPGQRCPRCNARVHRRKRHSTQHSWAYMLGAFVLYIPANAFPMMDITKLGRTWSYTITGGMLELNNAGFLPLAILVFVASIVIPLFKLLALLYILVTAKLGIRGHLVWRMRLYRLIRFIGRWSMVDVFMLSIMVGLVQFGRLAQVTSGIGALCFAAVVVLTMLAVESFDIRLMWDAAGKNQLDEQDSYSMVTA